MNQWLCKKHYKTFCDAMGYELEVYTIPNWSKCSCVYCTDVATNLMVEVISKYGMMKTVGTVNFHHRACMNCLHRNLSGIGKICKIKPELYYHADAVECADYLSIESEE